MLSYAKHAHLDIITRNLNTANPVPNIQHILGGAPPPLLSYSTFLNLNV